MSHPFKTIGLIGKYGSETVSQNLPMLVEHLLQRHCRILLDESNADQLSHEEVEVVSRRALGENSDLVIIVGGDGTLLNAARSLADFNRPLLGINLGRLGFLVDISPELIPEKLDEILNGNYQVEERALLHASVMRSGELIGESAALNDAVIHKWDVSRMIELETYIDGRFLHSLRADGLIVTTPTGSTAYALSGGGPIIHPTLEAIGLVPICPHTLTNRPIVVAADSRVEIVVFDHNNSNAQLTCDGQIDLGLMSGDHIVITRKTPKIRILHPADYDYFEILRTKLHWGKKL